MSIYRAYLLVVCSMLLTVSCGNGSGGGSEDWSSFRRYVTAYIPYVEEVAIPDSIYADEEFVVRLRVSSVLEPRLLMDDPRSKIIVGFASLIGETSPGWAGFVGWRIEPWMRDSIYGNGVVEEWLDFTCPPLPAGGWQIGVDSPKSRELGGMSCLYEINEGGGAYSPDVETRIYPITVIERPQT